MSVSILDFLFRLLRLRCRLLLNTLGLGRLHDRFLCIIFRLSLHVIRLWRLNTFIYLRYRLFRLCLLFRFSTTFLRCSLVLLCRNRFLLLLWSLIIFFAEQVRLIICLIRFRRGLLVIDFQRLLSCLCVFGRFFRLWGIVRLDRIILAGTSPLSFRRFRIRNLGSNLGFFIQDGHAQITEVHILCFFDVEFFTQ